MSTELKSQLLNSGNLPSHVAIIMDGNGRWAVRQGKRRVMGHKAGVEMVRESVKLASELKLGALTLFAFSSENWRRPAEEVSVLMELFFTVLSREVKRLNRNNVKLQVIGDTCRFSDRLRNKIAKAEELTANNTGLVLSIAANYGGRWDITQACQQLATKVADGQMAASDITEELINQHTCTAQLPELDLMIRSGGDCRISNFLLWQSAYTELYFTDTLWPDFNEAEFLTALAKFADVERRFGCTSEQVSS
ncbi:isoprenyl transferase [Psychrobium sp. 1_MG-2023]|uniref:isoprenyl transferase n=1 Tax=Psychrobium sp. 1_MG-2023 TaxID=3062624 RepID=UPI000C3485F4|nr:isoprenyl transferase [Psychrobium sp. 1_MG-2023]MDP2559992.1 isoprenyl transferase [Psychrobium sp. 1_MG-2023]PKF56346.1 di-trans,poly-cis-decaprenylcistransferase [Alteromonadales bacterium alter-6D02]